MSSTQQLLLGEGAGGVAANYIEDVFSTWLYTGNGSIQSIPNGINLGPNTGNSNYFNAGQINTNSSASAFDLGTSDWTVECWIKTSYTSRIDPFELNGGTSSGFFGLTLNSSASGDIEWNESSGGSSVAVVTATGTTVANGSWHNIAVTRSGNSVRLFFDGTQVGSTYTTSYTYGGASKAFRFGNRYPGGISSSSVFYISNFRIVKGTALYTTTFTPSTQPLTQISGTSYLGAQSLSSLEDTTLIGNSYTNNVTPNGSGPFSYGTGSGGLVWMKGRSGATSHSIFDTSRGTNKELSSNTTGAQSTLTNGVTEFNSSGFTIGANSSINTSAATYVSWTFRKQPKFFDVVTYTGDGNNNRLISHNLGSTPGCVIVKCTSAADAWAVWHRSLTSTQYSMALNTTAAQGNAQANQSFSFDGSVSMSSTQFVVSQESGNANSSGKTYVAYLFAHNAGGFGLTGTDNVISCGSFTTDGSGNATVSLGYEPQWVLVKRTNTVESWQIIDNMRGWPVTPVAGNYAKKLIPNSTAAEADTGEFPLTNTGFNATGIGASNTYIYIAIRRGPMKVPTSGTSVFIPIARTGTGTTATVTTNFSTDLIISHARNAVYSTGVWDRLRGIAPYLETTGTASESTSADSVTALPNTAYVLGADTATDRINRSGDTYANWAFSRAPSFFDIVCYTGTGVARTVTHNLGVAPELMIVKSRSIVSDWRAYSASLGATQNLKPNTTDAATSSTLIWNDTAPTSSVFTVGTASGVNGSGNTYVAYLFATCAGVSKVGSYTGTGALQTVACGFTGGARFVLIKRTNSTGNWYIWDSARGISSGDDPYLLLNSTAAEVTGTNYVDTDTTGFKVTAAASTTVNISAATYIFLAIA